MNSQHCEEEMKEEFSLYKHRNRKLEQLCQIQIQFGKTLGENKLYLFGGNSRLNLLGVYTNLTFP
jgi:hypothetical protein